MRDFFAFLFETIKLVLIAILIVLPIRYFLFQPFFVQGSSMEPNFYDGDYLIVDELSYRFADPQRGDIIIFNYPENPSQRYIKRVIGLPSETVEIRNGSIIIDSEKLDESSYLPDSFFTAGSIKTELAENEYFVLGDNRPFSSDSRRWGPLERSDIIGKVYVRAWPFTAFAKFEVVNY